MDSSSYEVLQRVKALCKESKTKQEAQEKLKTAGLWFEFLPMFRPYMDLP